MKRLHTIKFHPVLVFYPFHLDEEVDYPYSASMEERYVFWKSVMERFGMAAFEPVKMGGEEVAIASLDQAKVDALVKWALPYHYEVPLEERSTKLLLEHRMSLPGGLYLKDGNETLISSQCCVNFNDYREWIDLEVVDRWKRIYIGHPWIYYQYRNGDILLSEYIDDFGSDKWSRYNAADLHDNCTNQMEIDMEEINDSVIRFQIAQPVFEQAIEQLKNDIQLFKSKLTIAIRKLGFEPAEQIANLLLDGNGESTSYSDRDKVYLKTGQKITS